MVNPDYVLALKNKVRGEIVEIINKFNRSNIHEDKLTMSMAFKLNVPSDFNPGDNIIQVITQDQHHGKYWHFANIIVTINPGGGTTNIGIDVMKVLKEVSPRKIHEPMPEKDTHVIKPDKAKAIIDVLVKTVGSLRAVESAPVPRGTIIENTMGVATAYQPRRPVTPSYYRPTDTVPTMATQRQPEQPRQPVQQSLIKIDDAMDRDLAFREFMKTAPKWYRSILSDVARKKVRAYVYEVWRRTNDNDSRIWGMIQAEFLRKGLLAPRCQLFPERKKFTITADGDVRCEWTNCPHHTQSGYCNYIRLKYGVE